MTIQEDAAARLRDGQAWQDFCEMLALAGELCGGDHRANIGCDLVDEWTRDTRRPDYGDHRRNIEARIGFGERRFAIHRVQRTAARGTEFPAGLAVKRLGD